MPPDYGLKIWHQLQIITHQLSEFQILLLYSTAFIFLMLLFFSFLVVYLVSKGGK
jgi:hypothetical protein